MPTEQEVKNVIFTLNGKSAGGPDGFTRIFYQKCRNITGKDIIDMIQMLHIAVPIILLLLIHERLAEGLPDIISLNQAGFVKGRSIVENVLLTQEIIADIRLSTRIANVVMKLDMTKAYDRVSWIISNNWYSVLINGQQQGFFQSSRAVKQGDPLSPTLFILAAEVLTRNLNRLHQIPQFRGFGMLRRSPKINHLAYADDMIIFTSADVMSLQLIMEKGEMLSFEGRAGLIKHVLQGMRIHLLSAMNPPDSVIKKMHKMFAQFFRSNTIGGKSRHWISWIKMCIPEKERGIGFRSMHDVYMALYCKIWWNFRTLPYLWSSYMSNKYSKKIHPVIVQWKYGTQTWKKMLQARDLIERHIWWQVKMGDAQFWYDNWTGLGALYYVIGNDFYDERFENVKDMVTDGRWDVDKLREVLSEEIVQHDTSTIISPHAEKRWTTLGAYLIQEESSL
ncbi:uncharacterized protein LOC132619782 [Lycium barbarum]|uniref:uncharacterized protein LOC132619782 n=1 Tax=Lycium barbarum TaxID=112863 RepID=UPI00293F6500|nr:uncharacterized protein LOC132619782 [Lycium barbarum]